MTEGWSRRVSRNLAILVVAGLPLAACDKGPTTADIRHAIVEEAIADKPLMRTLPADQLMPELEVTSRTCSSVTGGAYKCSVALSYMGQEKTVNAVFRRLGSGWTEVR